MAYEAIPVHEQPVLLANISTSDSLQYLILQKSNYVKGALGIAVPWLTSETVDFFLEVVKKSHQTLVMLSKVLKLLILIFWIFKYSMYVMLHTWR